MRLLLASSTPIQRHVKVKSAANPYDPAHETYFENAKETIWRERFGGHGLFAFSGCSNAGSAPYATPRSPGSRAGAFTIASPVCQVVPRVQTIASGFIQSATTGFTANIFPYRNRVSPKEAFEGLEPDEAKVSRPVLRGPGPSVVKGTVFFISSEGHFLTCAHVVAAAGGWERVRVEGRTVALAYSSDPARDDVAILETAQRNRTSLFLGTAFRPLDRFLTLGFGRSDFPSGASIDGTITDSNPQSDFGDLPMIRLRVNANSQRVQAGFTGGPVFDAENQCVVGVIAAYDNTEGALAVPVSTILQTWPRLTDFLVGREAQQSVPARVRSARVFISYRSDDPDLSLAQTFYEELLAAGHQPFIAGESLLGDDWPARIGSELEESDYFLLLLSSRSATSDMVTEEVKRAKP